MNACPSLQRRRHGEARKDHTTMPPPQALPGADAAGQLFPGADLRCKKDHGRAEALLLVWWGKQQRFYDGKDST